MRQDETDSDNDDTDHAVSPTSSSSSWRGRNESGTITARARSSTNKHESDKEKTQQSSSGTETKYILSSSVFRDYVKPILMEDSQETIDELSRKFGNWFREETDFHEELIKHYCEKEEFDKVNIFMAQWTAVTQFFREQVHLIRLHCDCIEILAGEERTSSQMNERFHEDDNIEHSLNCQTDEQSDEESPETANNAFLPRSNVVSHQDEADSYSLNSQTEDDDNQEDDDMTYMLSLISDIERRMEELRNSFDNDETDADSQNDLTESEAEDEWFQAVGNSSPMDPESHDIETVDTSYKNGQNSRHPIETTEVFSESVQTSNNNETFESNKTVPDISAELSKGLMFGLDLHKEGLFKSDNSWNDGNNENLRNDLSYKTLRIMTNRKGKQPEEPTETEEEPFRPQPDTVTHNKAVNQNRSEVKAVINHYLVTNNKPLSRTESRSERQIKRIESNFNYQHRQIRETDQIMTDKMEKATIWMLQVLKRYFRQHIFKSSKPPSIM